jgi:hypothetical protein
MKQAKLQWLQNANQAHGDNLKHVGRENNRTFRKKKVGYLKKLMILKQTVKTKLSGTNIEA